MIASFRDSATKALFHGESGKAVKKLPPSIRIVAIRKLDMLNASRDLGDLRSPPGNRLETLKGRLAGRRSIRVNEQWRVVVRWESGDAFDVEIVDYH